MQMKTLTDLVDDLELRTLRTSFSVDTKACDYLDGLLMRTEVFSRDNPPSPFILARPGWNSQPAMSFAELDDWKRKSPREDYSLTDKGVTYTLHIFKDYSAFISFKDDEYAHKIVPAAFRIATTFNRSGEIHGIKFDTYPGHSSEILKIYHDADGGCYQTPLIQVPIKQGDNARKVKDCWKSCVRRDLPKIVDAFRAAPNLARDFSSLDKWLREDLAMPCFASVKTFTEDQKAKVAGLLKKCSQYVTIKDPDCSNIDFQFQGGKIDGHGHFRPCCIWADLRIGDDFDHPAMKILLWLEHVLCEEEYFLPNDAKVFFANYDRRSISSGMNAGAEIWAPSSAHEALEICLEIDQLMARYPVPKFAIS